MRSWRFLGVALALVSASTVSPGTLWAVQCAPYARDVSGIDLHGSAWTWWQAAYGQYSRGATPELGAVLVFKKSRAMPYGHVATVTEIVNARAIRVSHANWAGRRAAHGRVETDMIVDESPKNNWSQVRVWYGPVHEFGMKIYPVYGFIYPAAKADRS